MPFTKRKAIYGSSNRGWIAACQRDNRQNTGISRSRRRMALRACTLAIAARTDVKVGLRAGAAEPRPDRGSRGGRSTKCVYANVFEGLTRIGSNGEVLPRARRKLDISDDGLTYTFQLHKGVKFHDGTDFNADDVKFSLDRAHADKSTNAQKALFAAIDTVEVVDPATVKVTLKQPDGDLSLQSGLGRCGDRRAESADDQQGTNPIGTGPFKFALGQGLDRSISTRTEATGATPARSTKRHSGSSPTRAAAYRHSWPATSQASRLSELETRCRSSRPTRASRL